MKKYQYTVLTIILSLIFSFGSMASMHLILKTREHTILSESGKIQTAMPVEDQAQDVSSDIALQIQSRLSAQATEQMEQVIRRWSSDTDRHLDTFTHIPSDNEIPMEEAIAIGNEWLLAMNLEQGNDSVYAILGSMPSTYSESLGSRFPYDSYFSLWKLQYSTSAMRVILYIHAMEGKVWKADITLYDNLYTASLSTAGLKRFAELAGLAPSGNTKVNSDDTQATLDIQDSPMSAQVDFVHRQTDPHSGHTATGALDFKAGTLYKENIHIVYQFTIEE